MNWVCWAVYSSLLFFTKILIHIVAALDYLDAILLELFIGCVNR